MQQMPKFDQLEGPLSAELEINGQGYLYFGGTAYLGIPQHKAFIKHYVKGINSYGLNNGTSRSNNVQLSIYDEAEHFAAHKFGAASCLITSSGYLAAQLTIKQLAKSGMVRYAPATHPALWLNEQPIVSGSFKQWVAQIVEEINTSQQKQWVLISNSMNNLFPEVYDFSFIEQIHTEKEVILIVDDSHGIGINNDGLGAFSSIPKQKHVKVVVLASMAKALGVDAGLILGPEAIIAQLKQSEEFLGASPPSAAGLYAFMQADDIYKSELAQLKVNMALFTELLSPHTEWHFTKDFPVYLSKNAELSNQLLKQHILVSSFAYPTKNDPKINRIVLNSLHSDAHIKELITALKK